MLTNDKNIPLAIAVWLATDDYSKREGSISVTTLMKSVRQIVLSARAAQVGRDMDVSVFTASRMGTAIHDSIEKAWLNPKLPSVLKALGYSDDEIAKVRVNPPEDADPIGYFDVYVENQMYKEFMGHTIKGQYDLILNGQLNDHKSTVTYMYTSKKNIPKYVLQGSIYRWMDPVRISSNIIQINYFFTDWSKLEALRNPNTYPQDRSQSEQYTLLSTEEVEKYLTEKIKLIEEYSEAPEETIPLCSDEDLWRTEDVFKYYADPVKMSDPSARSSKNFSSYAEAQAHLNAKGVGAIKTVKGQVKACNYCNAQNVCSQRNALLASGELQPQK